MYATFRCGWSFITELLMFGFVEILKRVLVWCIAYVKRWRQTHAVAAQSMELGIEFKIRYELSTKWRREYDHVR